MEMTKEQVKELLLKELDKEQAQEIIDNGQYVIWNYLDDMIAETLSMMEIELPEWVQLDAFGTWASNMRYWDCPPIFVNMPKELPNPCGNDRDEWIRIMKNACEYSPVLEYWI